VDIFTEIKRTHVALARKANALRRTSFLWGMALGHAKGVETPDVEHLTDEYWRSFDALFEVFADRTPRLASDSTARDQARWRLILQVKADFERGLKGSLNGRGLSMDQWAVTWMAREITEADEDARINAEFAQIVAHFDDPPVS